MTEHESAATAEGRAQEDAMKADAAVTDAQAKSAVKENVDAVKTEAKAKADAVKKEAKAKTDATVADESPVKIERVETDDEELPVVIVRQES